MATDAPLLAPAVRRRLAVLKAGLFGIWALVSFVSCYFARDLQFMVADWPFSYWMAAQGALLAFIAVVAVYAWAMNRAESAATGEALPEQGGRTGA